MKDGAIQQLLKFGLEESMVRHRDVIEWSDRRIYALSEIPGWLADLSTTTTVAQATHVLNRIWWPSDPTVHAAALALLKVDELSLDRDPIRAAKYLLGLLPIGDSKLVDDAYFSLCYAVDMLTAPELFGARGDARDHLKAAIRRTAEGFAEERTRAFFEPIRFRFPL